MKEIGSEFWLENDCLSQSFQKKQNIEYLLSGRGALDFIIRDIKMTKPKFKVLLPSYCCDSMIEPFLRNLVDVQFYSATRMDIDLYKNDADVILLIDYFGYENPQNISIAHDAKVLGKIVIYDSTHNLCGMDFDADYVFCSYRKWTYCNFAEVRKNNGDFLVKKPIATNEKYIEKRNKAAKLKAKYISGDKSVNKSEFLALFADAEEMLDKDFECYLGQPQEIDIDFIKGRRKGNALRLIDGLGKVLNISLWRGNVAENEIPMFVPILVKEDVRNDLRCELIRNNIYCPIHWPFTDKHTKKEDIYDMEISLVCDQRYSLSDMDREIEVIQNFFDV